MMKIKSKAQNLDDLELIMKLHNMNKFIGPLCLNFEWVNSC